MTVQKAQLDGVVSRMVEFVVDHVEKQLELERINVGAERLRTSEEITR